MAAAWILVRGTLGAAENDVMYGDLRDVRDVGDVLDRIVEPAEQLDTVDLVIETAPLSYEETTPPS